MVEFKTLQEEENRVLELLGPNPKYSQGYAKVKNTKYGVPRKDQPLYPTRKNAKTYLDPRYFIGVKGLYGVTMPDITNHVPFMNTERVPSQVLGDGVLGRCYTGRKHVQIKDDLYYSFEVYVHELKHDKSPWLSEQQVRFWTKQMLGNTTYH